MQKLVLFVAGSHSKHLSQHQSRDAMAIHARTILAAEVALVVLPVILQHKLKCSLHRLATWVRVRRLNTHAGHRHYRQRRHGRVVSFVINRTSRLLLPDKKRNRLVDRNIHFIFLERRHLRLSRFRTRGRCSLSQRDRSTHHQHHDSSQQRTAVCNSHQQGTHHFPRRARSDSTLK